MGNFTVGMLNGLIKALGFVLNAITFILPPSPFKMLSYDKDIMEFLAYINYVMPLNEMIVIGETWLISIGVYYIYSIALRWLKAIE